MNRMNHCQPCRCQQRRGSTLVIVIALLGLLSLMGLVFFTFAAQSHTAAENFADAAKATRDSPDNVWDQMLRQLIQGPNESEQGSILYSPSARHSLLRNQVGSDIYPHTGTGVTVAYDGGGVPTTTPVHGSDALLEFVDSPAARDGQIERLTPEPDVSYTYPDINHPFLAYRGWAIRDNSEDIDGDGMLDTVPIIEDRDGDGILDIDSDGDGIMDDGVTPRFEQVPVIIPSWFRPQYMSSGANNRDDGAGNLFDVVADPYWAYADDGAGNPVAITNANRGTVLYPQRSFRPHPLHIAGVLDDGSPGPYRFLTDDEATALGVAAGGFPFLPENIPGTNPDADPNIQGELGVLSGAAPIVIELDVDNDGDGIKEGIWIDTHFPIQQHTDSGGVVTNYAVLHSMTVYDLDALLNLNAHGNLTGLSRTAGETLPTVTAAGDLTDNFLSRSNLGLGPSEVNPIWALRRYVAGTTEPTTDQDDHFDVHFGTTGGPASDMQQANMEYVYLKLGRGEYDIAGGTIEDVFPGVYGDADLLYSSLESRPTALVIAELPRPGLAADVYASIGTGISFAGRDGFDDNFDRFEGEPVPQLGRLRPFGHPLDYSGAGRHYASGYATYNSGTGLFAFPAAVPPLSNDPRVPLMLNDPDSFGPEQWRSYIQYHRSSTQAATPSRYTFGPDGVYTGDNGDLPSGAAGNDDLNHLPVSDALFEDPLEVILEPSLADKANDDIFTADDVPALFMTNADITGSEDEISTRVTDLADFAFDTSQTWQGATADHREMFTTLSNSLRHFALQRDDRRFWEFTADSDGADNNGDGFGDGDGQSEFPPSFNVTPYGPDDPFRPQVRRLLTNEIGEGDSLDGALPLSLNHLLDVERTDNTPLEGSIEFLRLMQRGNLRFRPVTEHPDASEGNTVLNEVDISEYDPAGGITDLPTFPPTTVQEREFWARRDRQKLARDIYVLLYTIGGARVDGVNIKNYTGTNDPDLDASSTAINALYSHSQLRAMAQFAVNMVDAMDTDNVVTRFEYDKNLGDGWQLDDNAFTNSDDPNTAIGAAATANGLYPDDTNGRGVVYGVEAQELVFNEVLGIRFAGIPTTDHPATPFEDNTVPTGGLTEDRDFLHVELKNVLPGTLDLATTSSTTAATAVWRLGRFERPVGSDPVADPQSPDREIVILEHDHNEIDGGGRFSIGAASDPGLATSSVFLDLGTAGAYDGTYELIVPDVNGITLPVSPSDNVAGTTDAAYDPLVDIDVLHEDHVGRFLEVGGNFMQPIDSLVPTVDDAYNGNDTFNAMQPGLDLFGTTLAGHVQDGFDLVLQRRLNPNMPSLDGTDNPWIEVDRIRVMLTDFNIADGDTPATIFDAAQPVGSRGKLENVKATERIDEPLDDSLRGLVTSTKTVTPERYHTIKGESTALTTPKNDVLGINWSKLTDPTLAASVANPALPHELWQPHFDRDFATPAELLTLPLYGPNLVTQRLERSRFAAYQQVGNASPPPNPDDLTNPEIIPLLGSAESKFLLADFPDGSGATDETTLDNRWYRLFGFVEVPSRINRMVGEYLNQTRVQGKINLNMIRHLEVWAALIDDPMFADTPGTRATGPFMTENTPDSVARDRWLDLINERDGSVVTYYDETPNALASGDEGWARMWIPGTPHARPFHAHNHIAQTGTADDNGLDNTIFRRGALDRDYDASLNPFGEPATVLTRDTTNRGWLEVGSQEYHVNPDDPAIQAYTANGIQRHQLLSKLMNNTTTVSNCFVVFATVGYFEAYEDPGTGFWRIGGRIDLEGADDANPGWQQRAVFVVDRTDFLEAYDAGTGTFDWERLVKFRADIE